MRAEARFGVEQHLAVLDELAVVLQHVLHEHAEQVVIPVGRLAGGFIESFGHGFAALPRWSAG